MIYLLILIAFVISIVFSMLIIPRILIVALTKRLFDIPDERKIHTGAVPRLGGISFAPIILFTLAFISAISYLGYLQGLPIPPNIISHVTPDFYLLTCGLILLYLAGIKDDLIGLHYSTKFIIQILAASLLPLSGLWLNNLYGLFGMHELPAWLGMPLTIFVIVFICNAINLIDGIDGLASGLSGVSLMVLGVLFLHNQMWTYATLAFSTLGVYNPEVTPYSTSAILVAFSTLIVPMFDVIRVMLIRFRSNKGLFSPDKNHIHHKFLKMGCKPHGALLYILGISIFFSGLNIILAPFANINILFLTDIILWTALNLCLDKLKCI